MIVFAFSYSTITVLPAFLEVWSKFSLGKQSIAKFSSMCNERDLDLAEGLLVSCSFDYLSDNWTSKSYSLFIFFFDFCVPLMFISYFYSFIVKAVVAHERALREQAKKMNVESLRSNEVGSCSCLGNDNLPCESPKESAGDDNEGQAVSNDGHTGCPSSSIL